MFINIIIGEVMKKLDNKGWGMDTLIGFMIAFVLFLIIIVILSYRAGVL